ncbi:hypothetical protein EG339_20870 [Chryseobacterium bernardetii]|uniref:Uncharacterized protein n=2 Tax=Chryseobacterium bernardetii TaxID=1241978 RepID=A0A3G6TC89_9FLAO|nr:hypothetical protein [Chryseobacterium bernardetii]AZB26861.1 hypothetical protein EG339_20870 [Chryseobacterium bernardetii]
MKPTAKITEFMFLKVYSEIGRNNFEIAIVNLSNDWLNRTKETMELVEMLGINPIMGYIAKKEHTVRFLVHESTHMPFYEQWFGENELTFVEADAQEIEWLCNENGYVKSDVLLVHSNGMARYQAFEDIRLRTSEFDLKLIQEILTHQN